MVTLHMHVLSLHLSENDWNNNNNKLNVEFNEKTFQRKVNEIADKKTEPKPQPKKRNT